MAGANSAAMTEAIFSVFIISRHIPQGGMDKVILITALQTAYKLWLGNTVVQKKKGKK